MSHPHLQDSWLPRRHRGGDRLSWRCRRVQAREGVLHSPVARPNDRGTTTTARHPRGTIAGSARCRPTSGRACVRPTSAVIPEVLDGTGGLHQRRGARSTSRSPTRGASACVINLSLGHLITSRLPPMRPSSRRSASKAGIIVLAARATTAEPGAARPGYAGINSPGGPAISSLWAPWRRQHRVAPRRPHS